MVNFKLLSIMIFIIAFVNITVNVFADSSNRLNKVVTVKEGDFNDEVFIRIMPYAELKMDDTIFITIENAEFYDDLSDYQYKALGDENTYDFLKNKYNKLELKYPKKDRGRDLAFELVFKPIMKQYNSSRFPYKISLIDKNKMEVKLFGITDYYVYKEFADVGKPVYHIPLPFNNVKKGNVYVIVDNNSTSIRGNYVYQVARPLCRSEKKSNKFYLFR